MCNDDMYFEVSFEEGQAIDEWVMDGAKCVNTYCLHNHYKTCNLGLTGRMRELFDIHITKSDTVFWCNKGDKSK